MLTALDVNGDETLCSFSGQRCTCPECREVVIGKYGQIVTPHFAHAPSTKCERARTGETEWHRGWKYRFAKCGYRLEVRIGNHRADAVRGDQVIEIQRRELPQQDYESRTETYGDGLVWLIDGNQKCISVSDDGHMMFGSYSSLGWLEFCEVPILVDFRDRVDLISSPRWHQGKYGEPYFLSRVFRTFLADEWLGDGPQHEQRAADVDFGELVDCLVGAGLGALLKPGARRGARGELVICV